MADVHQPLRLLPSHRSEWPNEPSGACLLRRHYRRTLEVDSDQEIDELEDQLKEAGPQERFEEKPFAGLHDRATVNGYNTFTTAEGMHDFVTPPTSRLSLAALSDTCPSLDSDHGDSSDGREDGDTIAVLQASTTACTVSQQSIPQRGPSIFASIRQVLSSDLSFADAVISKIKCLSPCKRALLVGDETTDNTQCTDGSSTQSSQSSDRPSKKRRKDDGSNGDSGGKQPPGDEPPGRNDKVGGGDEGGDKGKPPSSQQKDKKKRRWHCLFDLAYPNIHEKSPHFKHCSTGKMTERYQWRLHFYKHHSEEAKTKYEDSDENARFYMDEMTLEAVSRRIDDFSDRPRREGEDDSRSKAYLTELFIAVWDIIFPQSSFKPLSAFYPEDGETCNLEQHLTNQAEVLVEVMYDAKADHALQTGAIGYLPSAAEAKDLISKSIAVILHNSPSATAATHWLAHAPPHTIRAAGRDYGAQPAGQSATTPSEEEVRTETNGSLTPSTTMAEQPQPVPQASIMPQPSLTTGTHFEALPFPCQMQNDAHLGYPTLPPAISNLKTPGGPCMDFPLMNQGPFDQVPFSMVNPHPYNPMPFPMMNPNPYSPVPFPQETTVLPQQFHGDDTGWRGGQGVSLQVIEDQPKVNQQYGLHGY